MTMSSDLVYLDNAATTYPKPRDAREAMLREYAALGASPGRGGYDLAEQAELVVRQTRKRLARFFGSQDPDRVVFASNATDALNLALHGLLRPGDHVVSTRLEHNSVLRPLHHLRECGAIEYDLVHFDDRGFVDPRNIARAMKSNTRLVALCHASNVLGSVQPVAEIGRLCAERGVLLLLDAAQSAGVVPMDMSAWGVSALAFTGHKSLYGPTGSGGLVVQPGVEIAPSRFGGTGVDSLNLDHTPSYPHRLEAGTVNLLGVLGLSAGLDFLESRGGVEAIHAREMSLLKRLRQGLAKLRRVRVYTPEDLTNRVAVLLANVEGLRPADAGAILDADYGIAVRVGLHCAPLVHEDLGACPAGAIRFSLGAFNTEEDIDAAVAAMAAMAGG